MESFTPVASTVGGVIIGLSATILLLFHGRIAGMTGILAGLLDQRTHGDVLWRVWFFAGLLSAGVGLALVVPQSFANELVRSPWALLAAGLLVGFGTRLGSGCTSGHGVCGISRLAPRSLVATLAFILSGGVTVFFVNRVLGGTV